MVDDIIRQEFHDDADALGEHFLQEVMPNGVWVKGAWKKIKAELRHWSARMDLGESNDFFCYVAVLETAVRFVTRHEDRVRARKLFRSMNKSVGRFGVGFKKRCGEMSFDPTRPENANNIITSLAYQHLVSRLQLKFPGI